MRARVWTTMRAVPRMGLAAILVAAAAAAPAAPAADPAAAARRVSGDALFWSQRERDANFRAMERLVAGHVVPAGRTPKRLPHGRPLPGSAAIGRLMAPLHIAGLIVLQDGRTRFERYAGGYSAGGRWTSFSVAKSITATLLGAAIADGAIGSVDDPVTRYIPEFAGSAYDGVTIRQVLTMTSGVRWNEDYTDPQSDVVRLFAEAPPPGEDPTIAYLRRLPRAAVPGSKWVYKTGEANLIGVIVRRAVGRPLADYLAAKIWRPYGMARAAFWQTGATGQETGGCCLSVGLRDYARFGQFMLDGGRAGGRDVLPAGWIAAATAVQAPFGGGAGYGYQWWTNRDGSYRALGIFGQMIHVDPARRLVIVTSSDWPKATDPALAKLRQQLVDAIARAADTAPPAP